MKLKILTVGVLILALLINFISIPVDNITYRYSERDYSRPVVKSATVAKPAKIASRSSTSRVLTMTATAYHETGPVKLKGWYAGPGRVAVDPRVIPLGTRLWIENYGPAVAGDTGRLIKNMRLDVWFADEETCDIWGRKQVKVWVYK